MTQVLHNLTGTLIFSHVCQELFKCIVEDTRVILEAKDGVKKHDTYVNANFVHSPLGLDRKFIAAQGPKSNTVDHFWRMIIE